MRRKLILFLALAGIVLPGCEQEPVKPEVLSPEARTADVVDEEYLVPGQMIIELSDELVEKLEADFARGEVLGTKSSEVNSVFSGLGVISVKRLYPDAGEWEPRHREAGLHKWYKVTFDPNMPQTKAVRSIDEVPGVVFAEPVRRVKQTAFFNDPDLGKQWHYYNDGTLTSSHKKGCDINVVPVWERYTGGRKDVIVGVQDGGIELTHEDLAAVCIPGGPNGSKNFVDGSFQIDPHSHGTHVAGTIGAINNNGIGCCGIAGGLDGKGGVSLMSCQVFKKNPQDGEKDLSGGFEEAMVWACDHGAVISQNSWSHVYKDEEEAMKGGPGAIRSSIDYFIKYAGIDKNGNQVGPMKGGVVIFAAGNENWKIGWPAAYEPVIAVGSVAPDFTRASYSNYGDWVDIAAPGGSAAYEKGQVYSTEIGNKYAWKQGTSMACPHVSGVAALIVSHYGGPGFTNEMCKERLLKGAKKNALASSTQIGPLVDALGSMSYGSSKPPVAVKSHSVSVHSNFLDFSWQVTSDPDDKKAYGYALLAAKDKSLLTGIDMRNIPAAVSYTLVEVGSLEVGENIAGTLVVPDFNTLYYTAVVAYDYSKNYSGLSPFVNVTSGSNTSPVIRTDKTGEIVVKAHEVINVEFEIEDPDGHQFTVKFTPGSEAAESILMPSGKYRMTITGKNATPGKYTAVYNVTDFYGAVTELKVEYTILENHAPQPKSNPDDLVFTGMGQQMALHMSEYVNDPDGEQLKYEISTSPVGVVHLNQVDDVLNLTTLSMGLAHVIITGTDCKGLTATIELNVLVRDPASNPDVYPTQVKDYLNISDGTEKTLIISICNAAGSVIYETEQSCTAFKPVRVDMTGWAPARYGVTVVSDNKTYRTTVVKL